MLTTIFLLTLAINPIEKTSNDTLYVEYDNRPLTESISLKDYENLANDKGFPFEGGRHYKFYLSKQKIHVFTFHFHSYTPSWLDAQFYFEKVPLEKVQKIDFKDREWFDKTDYDEIINYFDGGDKVIMMYDKTQPVKNGSVYLVRVYFSFPAEE